MSHILGMHANTTGMARQRIAIRSSGRPARHVRNQKAAVYASSRISPCHGATQAQHGHPAVAILQSQPVLQPRRRRTSCAASGTISDTAAAVQRPPLQVTRSNFAASLPAIKQALQQCQFFSFDCEMTGLYLPNQDDHAADDVDDRYVKAAAAAEQFLVAQFGLSFFEWTGSSYEVRSFNFYLFPSTNGDIDVRFMSQVSALAFLASEGFDFNKMIYEGIPFLPLSWRDKQLRQSAAAAAAVNVNDLDEDELIYMQHLEEQISDWLAAAAAGGRAGSSAAASAAAADVLYLTAPPPQFAKLQQRLLAAGIGSSRWPGSSSSSDVELLYIIDQPAAGQISRGSSDSSVMLRVATAQQVAEDAQFRAAHRAEQLALMTGFSQIFELIRDSQKPAVGHNVRFDLAYTLASFIQRPLPKTWSEFKNLVGKWFPGGVYDTKYLAHCLKFVDAAGVGRLLLDSSLGGCYSAMTPSDPAAPQPLGSSSSSTVSISNLSAWIEEKTQPLDNPHLWQTLPQVVHAPGCEAYAAAAAAAAAGSSNSHSSSISSAHEAGYDAFMTGVVFIGLMRVFEIEGVAQTSRWQQPVQPSGPPGLENVEQYAWRQFFSKSKAIEYAALQGPEMVPNKPEVLYLTKFAQGTKWQDIQKRVQQLGLGRPPVSFVRANGMNNQPTGAYVIFQNGKQAQKALQAIRANNSWKVQAMTYNDYFFSKHGSSNSSASEVVRARPAAVAAAAAATPAEEAGAPGKLVQQLQQKTAVARHRQQQRVEEQQQQNELLAFVMSSIEEAEAEAASSSGGDGQPDVAAAATNTEASPDAATAGSSSGSKAAAAAALLAERQRRLAQLQQQQLRQVHAASTPAAAGPVLRRPPAPPRQ